MLAPTRRVFVAATLSLTLALAACGGNTPAAAPTPEPAAEAPTRTPRPTREPTVAPTREPTAEPTREPTAEPTAEPSSGSSSSSGEIQIVEFGDLQTYAHSSGVFSIDIPDNWTLQNNDKPDEIIHVWTDPSRNGGVIVDIFEDDTEYTGEQLVEILNTFLENSFGSEPDYNAEEPTEQSDGSQLIVWSYTATADNDTDVPLLGNSFIEQRENKVSILTTLVPSEQFDQTVEHTNEIINTYSIDPSAPLTTEAGADASPAGTTLGGDTAGDTAAELPETIVAMGEAVTAGNLTLTVTGVEEPEGDGSFLAPEAGNKFIIVRTTFENSGSEAEPVSTLLQMSLVDDSGKKYDIDLLAATLAEQTPDGDVPAGGTLEGGVGFQVPADATGLVFVFEPLIEGEPVGVTLE